MSKFHSFVASGVEECLLLAGLSGGSAGTAGLSETPLDSVITSALISTFGFERDRDLDLDDDFEERLRRVIERERLREYLRGVRERERERLLRLWPRSSSSERRAGE